MEIKDIHRVYFIGIGGIGMSALARYFKFIGKEVAGYDKTETPLTIELSDHAISVHYKDDLELVPKPFLNPEETLVVYTPAVKSTHSEYQYFLRNDFVIKKRSEVLGLITKDSFCFAVAGTHGKTTTSSILAHLLRETGTPLTAFLGGISEDFNSNFLLEGTEYSVVEADEFDRSFLRLSPNVACITSMDADHLDIYGNAQELQKSFLDFVARIKPGGKLFVRKGLPLNGITYGIEDDSDYCIRNLKIEHGTYIFDLGTPEGTFTGVRFNKPGRHNLLNGLVAFAMAIQAGSPPYRLAEALASFKGVQRRFSYRIKNEDFVLIDDYAHHPTEIDAVYDAIVEMHPNKRILAIFQPHLFSRTKDFGDDFAKSLSKFPSVLLLEIYPAREEPMEGIDAAWLMGKMTNAQTKVVEKGDLVSEIKAQNPEVLVMMGAGDIGLEIMKVTKELEYAH
ncbi:MULTISPECIES: UDP-N-acetylmuramate--L-alanine ligase [Maribacter]|uniref:UDP-N-acetylmuramate--L-alanine ligase n=1 Tax=Maribacter flavus TaxID=1658664 RepID=A0A5B2TP46_9FLAO|nr:MULTISPECIES: UDP-N-acetylmuramate--L-alanine ligase [Maribacter]KAA2215903.1 UDP-N-acetylmuramate--L-alanine ligase [Maribacter flavus]MDC6406461.1 UDP-N-acetylmuramate--L-alanine ligase [Maribacter sp. PR66]MEE1973581.1 UDP-N-acetylmuramate--L-alanine ligase [Maribacter flavus]